MVVTIILFQDIFLKLHIFCSLFSREHEKNTANGISALARYLVLWELYREEQAHFTGLSCRSHLQLGRLESWPPR